MATARSREGRAAVVERLDPDRPLDRVLMKVGAQDSVRGGEAATALAMSEGRKGASASLEIGRPCRGSHDHGRRDLCAVTLRHASVGHEEMTLWVYALCAGHLTQHSKAVVKQKLFGVAPFAILHIAAWEASSGEVGSSAYRAA